MKDNIAILFDYEQLSIGERIDKAKEFIQIARRAKDKGSNAIYYAGMEMAESYLDEAAIMVDDLLTCHKDD